MSKRTVIKEINRERNEDGEVVAEATIDPDNVRHEANGDIRIDLDQSIIDAFGLDASENDTVELFKLPGSSIMRIRLISRD